MCLAFVHSPGWSEPTPLVGVFEDRHRRFASGTVVPTVTLRAAIASLLVVVLLAASASAEPARRTPPTSLADLSADVVRALADYHATLERARPSYEAHVQAVAAAVAERRALYEAGAVAASAMEEAERALADAQQALAEHLEAIEEAERMLSESVLHERLARLMPLPPGRYEDASGLVRYAGTTRWSLRDLGELKAAFSRAFGRPLPVSAVGQTRVHDRLGLDHRNAVDVAVHPDSAEGRWLMAHLREAGVPFIGLREAIPGSATGAHVHVGPTSPRLHAR
ncbi:MAG: hypothetical protein HYU51_04215 [Candidatus Rokubacteria bacterium]|nr:hypothetical protein [Candidatus Rokubacteria bacterium]